MSVLTTLSATEIDNRKAMTRNSQSLRKTVAVRDINLINDTTIEYQGKRLEITKDAFKALIKMIGMSQAFANKFESLFSP
jgi:chemotaxis receptor (MCP) glutamine deamidase CheD